MKVVFMPVGKSAEAAEGKSVLQAAMEQGILMDSPCGGHHTCGKCRVLVTKGNDHAYAPEETMLFTEEELARGMRLACCCQVKQDMTVMVPSVSNVEANKSRAIGSKLGNSKLRSLGVAVDVGTTTVELQLVDLATGEILRKCKFYNPQIAFGADVIARITYAAGNETRERQLKDCLVEKLEQAIRTEVKNAGCDLEQVKRITLVGNTTMSYILTGTSLSYLAKAPFSLVYLGNTTFSTGQIGILPESKAEVYIGPNIGGHVGSDAFACLTAVGLSKHTGPYLIVDVGTNGEILLVTDTQVYACSTAAGPAFEGAGLSCGMRAENGAITKAEVKDGALQFLVQGNTKPVGISGSGIIDVLAGMLKLGVMEDSGYLKPEYCGEAGYEVTEEVVVTREDVRQIQLAKAAIYAGIRMLLQVAETPENDLAAIYLAGAFGSNMNIRNAMQIGLLPKVESKRVHYIGNAALKGAKQELMKENELQDYEALRHHITHVELAELEGFQNCFIDSINFRSDLF